MIALDTTAIIDFFKKEESIKKAILNTNEPLASTIINYQEIFFGLNLDNINHRKEEEYYDGLFDNIFILPFEKTSAKNASKLFFDLKKKGIDIGRFDCMIAGTLLSNGVTKIITRNVKHFGKIPGLKVISY